MEAAISLYLDENLSPKIAHQQNHMMGDWVKSLELICFVYTAVEMQNHVEYL